MRPAVPADTGPLAALDALAGPFPWPEERLRRALADGVGTEALVAGAGEAGERVAPIDIAGFVLFNCLVDEGTILNIAVHPDSQGRGLGCALLQAAMHRMREAGMQRCLLEVRRSNKVALALYRKLGFVEDGLRKNYYRAVGGREDAILLSRRLQRGERGSE